MDDSGETGTGLGRIIVVYYSRTGTTRMVAEAIRNALGCEIDEIEDTKGRSGILGWLRAGMDAGARSLTRISGVDRDPSVYDVAVIGSPNWNGTVSTPIRTYIAENNERIHEVALFSTGDSEEPNAIVDMEELLGRKAIARLHLLRKRDIEGGNYQEKVDEFVAQIVEWVGSKA